MVAAKEAVAEEGTEGRRILARAKSNLGPDQGGYAYSLVQVPVPGQEDLFASVITWGEGIAGSARDMLAVAEANDRDAATSASAEARSFLSEVLSVGPISAKEVFRQAAEAGIARRTLTRAKADAGVETKRSGGCPCRKFRPLGVRVRNVRALSRKSIFAESGMAAFGSSNGRPEALDRPASAGWHHRAFRIASKIMTEVRSAPIFPRRSKKS
jgi:hypothetical protein